MTAVSRIDKSKPIKDLYYDLAVEAELEERKEVAPPPADNNNQDCKLPVPVYDTPTTPTTSTNFKDDAIPFEVDDDIWCHKLGEAVVPIKLIRKFLDLFPEQKAHQVAQIADRHGKIRQNVRHIIVYDTYENMKKYERKV